jgi:Arc/MetJ-type ribon-helix-helix transcriptional regulator
MDVPLPDDVRAEVDELVRLGEFPDAASAVVELVRVGLGYRYRRTPTPALPKEPRELPRQPGLPPDVQWIG